MPYQDQLYVGYVPLDYNDLRAFVGKFGRYLPAKLPRKRNDIIREIVDKLDEPNPLGYIDVDGLSIPVSLHLPSWDADDEMWEALSVNPETKKLWCVIGVKLTSRYFPRILDKEYQHGRPEFFPIKLFKVNQIQNELFEFLKVPVELILMVQFY